MLEQLKTYVKDSMNLSAVLLLIYGVTFIYSYHMNGTGATHYDLDKLQSAFNWTFSLTHGVNSVFNSKLGEKP